MHMVHISSVLHPIPHTYYVIFSLSCQRKNLVNSGQVHYALFADPIPCMLHYPEGRTVLQLSYEPEAAVPGYENLRTVCEHVTRIVVHRAVPD
jgi:hypothetical protein